MRELRLIAALARVALMNAAQYRASFLVDLVTGAVSTVGIVLPLALVYNHTERIAGWSFHESLLVTGFFLLLQGAVGLAVEPNLSAIVEGVRSGALDYLVLKPVDAQLVASMQRIAPAKIWHLLAGVGVVLWGLSALPSPSLVASLTAVVLFVVGLFATYALWVLVICTSFWFVKVDNLSYLLVAVVDAGRWPVTVYKGWVRLFLTVVIPVAMVTSYPALALLGRLGPWLAVQGVVVAIVLLVISRVAWLFALSRYTSASS